MLERIKNLPSGIVGLRASAHLEASDYKKVLEPILDEVKKSGNRVKILYHFAPEFEGMSAGAIWQDFRIGMKQMGILSKCAVVSDARWLRKSCDMAEAILPCPIHSFEESDYSAAIDWLNSDEHEPIRYQFLQNKKVLLIEPLHPLDKEDFEGLAKAVDPWVKENGDLAGLVIQVENFPGWKNFGSMIRHFQFVKNHHKQISRVAFVADGAAAQIGPVISDHFVKADVKHFGYNDIEEAISWASGS